MEAKRFFWEINLALLQMIMARKYDGYTAYKRARICTRCGERTAEHGKVLCVECSDYKKKDYNICKDLKICVRCHKNPAEPHKIMCLECADKDSEQSRKNRQRNLEERKKRDLDKYNRLKEMGVCTYCKHEKAVAGKTKCAKCLAKIRNKRNAKKADIDRSERVAYGICYICGKDKVMDGKGVCEKCYEKRMESIGKIMYLPGSEFWRNDNKLIFGNEGRK